VRGGEVIPKKGLGGGFDQETALSKKRYRKKRDVLSFSSRLIKEGRIGGAGLAPTGRSEKRSKSCYLCHEIVGP